MDITDKVSREVLGEKTFKGLDPPSCRTEGRVTPAFKGMMVATSVIEDWIIETLSQEATLPSIENDRQRAGIHSNAKDEIIDLPTEWFVKSSDYPRYLLDITDYDHSLQCEYGIPFGQETLRVVNRVRKIVVIEILDLQTNEKLTTGMVFGSNPPECPETTPLSGNDRKVAGESPSQGRITYDLRAYLEPLVESDN